MTSDQRCPQADLHTHAPKNYVWQEWAAEMSKTHVQVLCPGCERYQIWVPKQ